MRLFVFNVLMFGALMLGWVSCQEYESGTYPLEESTVRYEGTLYDYLADKAAHPDVTYDSLLFLAGHLPGLKDSLQKRKGVTLVAVTDQSFRLAFDALNQYREAYGKGKRLGLEDLLIEPFSVVDTIVHQVSTEDNDTIYITRHYDYRHQLDSMLYCYLFNGRYSMDDVLNVGATEVPCMSYGHLMRMEVGRGAASGAEGVGVRYMRLIETWDSKVTTTWVKAEVESSDIMTRNGWLHVLSDGHEFGFNGMEQLFYDYGNEKKKK